MPVNVDNQASHRVHASSRDTNATKQAHSIRKASSLASAAEMTDTSSARGSFPAMAGETTNVDYVVLARDAKASIDWGSVVLSARTGPGRWHRHEAESADFAVYTKQESQRYSVLAVGLIRACAAEILNVLQASNTSQYEQQMGALYGDQFKEGAMLGRVDVGSLSASDEPQLRELTVKSTAFTKGGWFADQEQWCYLDAVYHDITSGVIEKYMKTIQGHDAKASSSGKLLHSVACGYLLRPGSQDSNQTEAGAAVDNSSTRVTFYAEFEVPKHVGITVSTGIHASDKVIKARLLKMAESTARLTILVRRQRLAMQTLVDTQKFLPPTNAPCMVCTRILRIAKVCRLCGQSVCGSCSAKHERVSRSTGSDRLRVARVRVCANCMERVDQAEYSNLSTSSLFSSRVVADSNNEKAPATVLNELLHQALKDAPSPARRAGVVSVIKALTDQDEESTNNADDDYLEAINHVEVPVVSADEVNVRSDETRSYQLDMRTDPAQCLEAPVPDNDAVRLNAVRQLDLKELGGMPELSIICDVAAKEMGCSTSTINIIEENTLYVASSNVDELRNLVFPRNQGMCAHTIMENSAHIVAHPEADIRFNKIASVSQYGVKYYCGFPLLAADGEVLGAMCCHHQESVMITESQFATFKKLAATAEKIVRIQTQKRQRQLSSVSA